MLSLLPIHNLKFSIKYLLPPSDQDLKRKEQVDLYGPVNNKIKTVKRLMNLVSFNLTFTFLCFYSTIKFRVKIT
jgi:hypothetical protein